MKEEGKSRWSTQSLLIRHPSLGVFAQDRIAGYGVDWVALPFPADYSFPRVDYGDEAPA